MQYSHRQAKGNQWERMKMKGLRINKMDEWNRKRKTKTNNLGRGSHKETITIFQRGEKS